MNLMLRSYRAVKHECAQILIGLTPAFRGQERRGPVNFVDNRTAISTRYSFVYSRIPKAANSTVVNTLTAASGVRVEDDNINVYKSSFARPSRFSARELDDIYKYFKFTIVRNPYDRFLSCYLDKIAGRRMQWHQVRRALRVSGKDISLDMFLYYLESGQCYRDPHWIPQVDMLYYGIADFDHIGRVESLSVDLQLITKRIFGDSMPIRNWTHHATGAKDVSDSMLSAGIRDRIYKIYEKDFDYLGYTK